ncbi:Cdc6/Cdc18 family protein [Saliphagus sp. GCM10025334]
MMTTTPIRDAEPLNPEFLPETFHGRADQLQQLRSATSSESVPVNLHLYGPRGTGKTHLARHVLETLAEDTQTCLVPCTEFDTQYKVLKQLCRTVTGDEVSDGYHASDLKRMFEERSSDVQTIIVLDQVDFLLLNDGSDLLYYLSRLQSDDGLGIITISETLPTLQPELEERTFSTLHPETVLFKPYSSQTLFKILWDCVSTAFHPDTVTREAVSVIASSTENAAYGLQWLKTAGEHAETIVSKELVEEVRPETDRAYVDQLLAGFSIHHRVLYEAVVKLTDGSREVVHTGEIYRTYRKLLESKRVKPLSDRRISDFIKHLELLQVIEADYHYGGRHGKTREIRLADETEA